MNIEEKAYRFDKIRAKAHELAGKALSANDFDAMLMFRLTMPEMTHEQVTAQRNRLKLQTKNAFDNPA